MEHEERDPLRQGERTADAMESRLDALGEHIGGARKKAAEQDEVAHPDGVAGDFEDESRPGDAPSGAFDDPEAEDPDED